MIWPSGTDGHQLSDRQIRGGRVDVREEGRAEGGTSHAPTNLAAMLAADLGLRGPSRVARIERKYLVDRQRTLPEIEAAMFRCECAK